MLFIHILSLKPNDDWLQADGKLNLQLFWNDDLHFSKTSYQSLELHYSVLFHRVTDLNQHHLIYQKYRNHFPHDQKPMSTFQPKRTTIIWKNICFVSLSISINCLHVPENSVHVHVTAICVVTSFSPFYFRHY